MSGMFHTISHPTDFSPEGQVAFVHALRLALAGRGRFDLLHVRNPHDDDRWGSFPRVREVLERWGILESGAYVGAIAERTGMSVHKIEISDSDAVAGLSRFLIGHRPDLLVMASHGQEGLNRWLSGSVSAQVAYETSVPTLLFGPAAEPFVDAQSGALSLKTILVPVAEDPAPGDVFKILTPFLESFGVEFDLVHVGQEPPKVHDAAGEPVAVRTLEGPLVESILEAAAGAQLIAMPTAGRQGFLDAFRGSTTEQVVRRASCPVLALPIRP